MKRIFPDCIQIPNEFGYNLEKYVSFSKGCYRGQEIIARLKYLGSKNTLAIFKDLTGDEKNELLKIGKEVFEIELDNIFYGQYIFKSFQFLVKFVYVFDSLLSKLSCQIIKTFYNHYGGSQKHGIIITTASAAYSFCYFPRPLNLWYPELVFLHTRCLTLTNRSKQLLQPQSVTDMLLT